MPLSPRPEQLLAAILSCSEDGLLSFSVDGVVVTWSRGAEKLYGYSQNEVAGQPLARILPLDEIPKHTRLLREARLGFFPRQATGERLRKDGSKIRVGLRHAELKNDEGEVVGLVESAQVLGCDRLGPPLEGPLRPLLEQMPAIVWTTDRELRITSNWGSALQSGLRPGQLVGQSIHDYLKCEDAHAAPVAQHAEALRGIFTQFEFRHKNRDLEIHLGPFRGADGEIIGCIGAGIDITERKRQEDQIHYQATHDALTGLANYREFIDALEREVRRADRSNSSFAVLLLDLDDLKRINDRLGHLAGNRGLQRLAEVMREHCRSTDVAARYGGDEFALLLIDADPGMARQVAGRVEGALRNANDDPQLTVSIGIGVYPDDGRTGQQLLEAADQHLYHRKKSARGQGVAAR
jgi:diguanylate cyclase (GGDEF)-like protein/PAS domain S-box-containing protein